MQTSVYLFVGNTSREIVAPLLLLQDVQDTKDTLNYDVPLRVSIGAFRGDPNDGDIAALAHPARLCASGDKCGTRLWLLPTSGDAAIAPSATKASKLPAPFDTALDAILDSFKPPGGAEQLVLAVPDGVGMTSLLTAEVSGNAFVPGAPWTVPFEVTQTIGKLVQLEAGMITANVDGSGLDLVLASPSSGVMVLAWDAGSKSFSKMVASRPYADLTKAVDDCAGTTSGGPSPEPGTPYPAMPRVSGDTVRAAAWPSHSYVRRLLAEDPSASTPQQSLMIVTPAGVVQASYATSQTGNLELTCVATSQADDATLLAGGYAIGTGDFDGDGVDDIAVSDDTGITLYYGNSYDPGEMPQASGAGGGSP
jgi:hypothetical protein